MEAHSHLINIHQDDLGSKKKKTTKTVIPLGRLEAAILVGRE